MSTPLRRLVSFPHRHPWGSAVGAVLLGLAGLFLWQGTRYVRFRHERSRAEEALARQDFDEARVLLGQCLAWRPADARAHFLAARAARGAELYAEAEEHLNEYRDLVGRATEEGMLERALLVAQRGEVPQVQEYLLSCLEVRHPQTDQILEALALGCVHTYRIHEAMNWLERLLRRQPGHVNALLTRGSLAESAFQTDRALADYRRAVQEQPDNTRALLYLGQALLRAKKYDEAVLYFERLQRRWPNRPDVLLGLARCHLEASRLDEAGPLLDRVLAERPENADALLEQGRLALKEGRDADAERWLRRALKVAPHDYLSHYHLARCLQDQGKSDEARSHWQRAARIEKDAKRLEKLLPEMGRRPRDPAPRLQIGLLCLRNGREDEALRWLHGALQVAPRHAPTHQALADYYERHGDTTRAAEHRRQAQLAPAAKK
jgi:tetratricopeptide (TPR) repeat protein